MILVTTAGQVGTEVLYFLVGSHDLDGGLMCTASHNPKSYTGAKLVGRGALALSGDAGIGDVRDGIDAGLGDPPGGGSVQEVAIMPEFQQAALKFIDPDVVSPLKVVVDGGNGMAGPMVGPLLEGLGLDLIEAYWKPNGEFPDHEPNPLLPKNREFIIAEVKRQEADLGIAWDGDADRCFFIDEQGAFVDGDFLTALLSGSMIAKEPGATVLYDVRASRAVADTAREAGGRALVNRVGHAFFKTRMRAEHAIFGGELRPRLNVLALSLAGLRNCDFDEIPDDLLDVAADIADLGEFRSFDLDERRAREFGQPPRDFGLADPGRPDHQDVFWQHFLAKAFGELLTPPPIAQGDGYRAFGVGLTDDKAVEFGDDFTGRKVGHVV